MLSTMMDILFWGIVITLLVYTIWLSLKDKYDRPSSFSIVYAGGLILMMMSFLIKDSMNPLQEKLEMMNLVDYDRHREETQDSLPWYCVQEIRATSGFATTNVNMRCGPSTKYEVIGVINKKEKVRIIWPLEGNWVKTRVKNQTGWISALHLRPAVRKDIFGFIASAAAFTWRGIFPEEGFFAKAIGWFLGSLISILIIVIMKSIFGPYHTFRFLWQQWDLVEIASAIPPAVFLAKNGIFFNVGVQELGITIIIYAIGSIVASGPATWVARHIANY